VAGAVTGNLTNLGNVAEVMADNLQNVAGNIHTNIHSAVNNALGLFRQKTLQVQVIAMISFPTNQSLYAPYSERFGILNKFLMSL